MLHVIIPIISMRPPHGGGLLRFMRYAPRLAEKGVQLVLVTPDEPEAVETPGALTLKMPRSFRAADHHELHNELLKYGLEWLRRENLRGVLQPLALNWQCSQIVKQARRQGWRSVFPLTLYLPTPPWYKPSGLMMRLKMPMLLAPFTRVLSNSRIALRDFRKLCWLGKKRCHAIPNGVDTERFHPVSGVERQALKRELGLPEDRLCVISVGAVSPRKDSALLVEAWRHWPEPAIRPALVLLGSGMNRPSAGINSMRDDISNYAEAVKAKIAELPEGTPVKQQGDSHDVQKWLQAADLFAFTSKQEGCPNALLEAMACGLPSVTTRFEGFPDDGDELGVAAEHFTLINRSPAELHLAMKELLYDHPSKGAEQGTAARRWIEELHSLPKIIDQLAAFYHQVEHTK